MRSLTALLLALLLASCAREDGDGRTKLVLQRFFGACEAEYGSVTDISKAEGECGIITAIINRFEAENPDIRVVENVVAWPGYDQLVAQLAASDAPDLVTMHGQAMSDYHARGLIEPLDADLRRIGIDPADFTDAARDAVTIDGAAWGMPFDTWAPLWHINMNLFRQAGLVKDGKPVLPTSRAELIAQAEQFKRRTGKPYLVYASANESASFMRDFFTLVMQQNGQVFEGPRRARFRTPEARNALELFKDLYDRGLTTRNQDYSAAVAGFMQGDGGVFLVGTWMVGTYEAEANKPGGALSGGYAVANYPQLFPGRAATFAGGHNWVMPRDKDRSPAEHEAALRFLRFFADHAFDWARTGHLPTSRRVIAMPEWRALPHRAGLATLADTGISTPKAIRRQFPIEAIVGSEAASAILGQKSIDAALADMERRVNEILQNL